MQVIYYMYADTMLYMQIIIYYIYADTIVYVYMQIVVSYIYIPSRRG